MAQLVDTLLAPFGLRRRRRSALPARPGNRQELRRRLIAMLSERTDHPADAIDGDHTFGELGCDSLLCVRLSGELGDWLGLELEPTLLWERPTVDALVDHLAGELGW